MRFSIAIAAAVIGFGGAAIGATPASAAPATPLVALGLDSAKSGNPGIEQVQHRRHYRHYDRRYDRRYHRRGWDHRRYRHRDRGAAAAAGILGLGVGAILGQSLSQPRYGGSSAHVQWCNQRFRSYDVRTDTYLNYDGNRYRCNSPYG